MIFEPECDAISVNHVFILKQMGFGAVLTHVQAINMEF